MITSRQHPLCKLVRSLHEGRQRRRHGLFVAEGANCVAAALAARWRLRQLVAAPEDLANGWQDLADEVGAETRPAHPDILAYISEAQTSPGVIALVDLPPPAPPDWQAERLVLVLDGIADPGNVGTLIRSADAAGAEAVIATETSADPFGPKAVRASAGSLFHLPPLQMAAAGPDAVVAALTSRDIPIIVAAAGQGEDCFNWRWPRRAALVLGHETRGVSAAFLDAAAAQVHIPIHGKAESLNVAAAGAVLLYAWRRGSSG